MSRPAPSPRPSPPMGERESERCGLGQRHAVSSPLKNPHLVASGVSRIIIPSGVAVRSDPAHAGCYFLHRRLALQRFNASRFSAPRFNHSEAEPVDIAIVENERRSKQNIVARDLELARPAVQAI